MQIKKYNFLKEDDSITTVEESLKANIVKGQVGGFSVVCNSNLVVVGVITDSDLRKASMKFGSEYYNQQAREIMNTEFLYLSDDLDGENQARQFLEAIQTKVVIQELAFRYLPVLDRSNKLVNIVNFSDIQADIERITTQVIVVGLGFVGINLSMAMVSEGLEILGVDSNHEIRENIKNGKYLLKKNKENLY